MPKHSRHTHRYGVPNRPVWRSNGRSPSAVLRALLVEVVGKPYDREPCPYTMTSWDTIPDPQRPEDPHRDRDRRTLTPCVRPAGHVRQNRMIPADKHGRTVSVPDEAARLHADATGRTW